MLEVVATNPWIPMVGVVDMVEGVAMEEVGSSRTHRGLHHRQALERPLVLGEG